jgi:hypothetical protein
LGLCPIVERTNRGDGRDVGEAHQRAGSRWVELRE